MNLSTWRQRGLAQCLILSLALCLALIAAGTARASPPEQDVAALLREGGNILLIRHATTVSGVGDPPGFRLDDCATQRNLSDRGRDEARRLGERLRETGARFTQLRSSAWCRCVDTARLAFGTEPALWPPLNSFFAGQGDGPAQTRAARDAAAQVPAGENWVWVTHQVNISALANVFPAMGEVLIVRPAADGFELRGRLRP